MTIEASNPFRGNLNIRLLRGLFFEEQGADKSTVLYSLKDRDHVVVDPETGESKTYPSMYRLYMEIDDPTEWNVSQQLVDGWEHWEMLCDCTWFKPYIERWRKELELRIRSKALVRVRAESKSNSKEALAANRYLLSRGWDSEGTTPKPKRGRPSKEEIKKQADVYAQERNRLQEDFERLTVGVPQ